MIKAIRNAALAISLLILGIGANAEVIRFDGVGGTDGAQLISHSEAGYLLIATQGNWFVAKNSASSPPSIFAFTPSGDSYITVSKGGQPFTLGAFDVETIDGQSGWQVIGSRTGTVVLELTGPYTICCGHFTIDLSYLPQAIPVDSVKISVLDTQFYPTHLDNIVVSSVPEPAAALLLVVGLAVVVTGLKSKETRIS